jgi:uncharacterized protein YigA (DUF484 family)
MSHSAFTDLQPLSPITEDDIANYLVQTPDFFERHAEVLATIELSSPHGTRAVSLQERQAGLLREKIRTLEQKVVDLIRHGQDNVAIADKLQGWTFGLLKTADPGQLPTAIAHDLAVRFAVPQVALRVWGVAPAWAGEAFAVGCSDNVQAFASSLAQPYCGGNPGLEAAGWLDDPAAAQSLALIALREKPGAKAFGLLVLASGDTQRFAADMGTDFLERIGELASAALARLRG